MIFYHSPFHQAANLDHHGHVTELVDGQLHVGRLPLVLVPHTAAKAPDASRQGGRGPQRPMGHVGLVYALVADLAVTEIPAPMPVVMDQVAVERSQFGRAGPVVEIQRCRRRFVGLETDAPSRLADVGLAHQQLAPLARLEGRDLAGPVLVAALLRAVLDDDAVSFRSFDALAAFKDRMATGLFHVDVLAGLTTPDRQQRMPVVGAGDGNGVQGLVFQCLADVLHALGPLAGELLDALDAGGEERAVGIDEVGDFHPLHIGILANVRPAPAVDSGHGHTDSVVGSQDSRGRFGAANCEIGVDTAGSSCSQSGGGKLDETAAGETHGMGS